MQLLRLSNKIYKVTASMENTQKKRIENQSNEKLLVKAAVR